MSARGRVIFRFLVSVVVLVGSFWLTLAILGYLDEIRVNRVAAETVEEVRPSSWRAAGGASYDVHGDAVVMRGPNFIFLERGCDQCAAADFSIDVQRAGTANVQLLFLDSNEAAVSQPTIQTISEMTGKIAQVSATAPPGAAKIRILVYSPQSGEAVTFANAVFRSRART